MITPLPRTDPAAQTAYLLRRLAMALVFLALPIISLFTRRAGIVLLPIGAALIVLSCMIEPSRQRQIQEDQAAHGLPIGVIAFYVLLAWALLSLIWTPFPRAASERLITLYGSGLAAVIAILCLPRRVSASGLNLLPLGASGALLVAIMMLLTPVGHMGMLGTEFDPTQIERTVLLVSLVTFAGMGWLACRGRLVQAMILAALVLVVAAASGSPVALLSALMGLGVFAGALYQPRRIASLFLAVTAVIFMGAPLIAFLLVGMGTMGLPMPAEVLLSAKTAQHIVLDESLRVISGHGFDAALRARASGLISPSVRSMLFDVWYDLGLVGAGCLATLCTAVALHARARPPGVAAAMLSVGTMTAIAIIANTVGFQGWWASSLGLVVLAMTAIDRGQARTTRPLALARVF